MGSWGLASLMPALEFLDWMAILGERCLLITTVLQAHPDTVVGGVR